MFSLVSLAFEISGDGVRRGDSMSGAPTPRKATMKKKIAAGETPPFLLEPSAIDRASTKPVRFAQTAACAWFPRSPAVSATPVLYLGVDPVRALAQTAQQPPPFICCRISRQVRRRQHLEVDTDGRCFYCRTFAGRISKMSFRARQA